MNANDLSILPETIFKLVMEMIFFGQKSLLQVDEFSEKEWSLVWHKSPFKKAASDTTVERFLEGFNIEILREILATSLSAEDMRELAHFRWEIENNTFKRLNSLLGSKRGYIRNGKVKRALLLIWFVGLILLGFCIMIRKLEGKKRRKETWRTIVSAWCNFVVFLWRNNSS